MYEPTREDVIQLPPRLILQTTLGPVALTVEGQGPPVLCLHANPGSCADWDAVAGVLAADHTVLRLDWPGYGASPAPDLATFAGAPSYASMLVEVLDQLAREVNLTRLVLVGNSVGGYAAISAALERPEQVSALVLVAPGGFTRLNPLTRVFCATMADPRAARWLVTPLARLYLRRRTPVTRAALLRTRQLRQDETALAVHCRIWSSFREPAHDLRDRAATLRAPVLLTWGAWDPVLPAATDGRRASRILRTDLTVFPSGHEPYAEVPERWLAVVNPFLASRRAADTRWNGCSVHAGAHERSACAADGASATGTA